MLPDNKQSFREIWSFVRNLNILLNNLFEHRSLSTKKKDIDQGSRNIFNFIMSLKKYSILAIKE